MLTPAQLQRIENGYGMNEPAQLVALEMGVTTREVQKIYYKISQSTDIYRLRNFKEEKRPPRVDLDAAQRFDECAKTALAVLADLQSELAPLIDGELHTQEAAGFIKKARAAIADAKASVRLRRVLSGEKAIA